MKTHKYKIAIIAFLFPAFLISCTDFLDVPVESDITEEDVFRTFRGYQGFIETMYFNIIDFNRHAFVTTANMGGETCASPTIPGASSVRIEFGTYEGWLGGAHSGALQSYLYSNIDHPVYGTNMGDWPSSWEGIRIASTAIERINLFTGTSEQRNLLLGQAYFFRAYFHFVLIKSWGGMPYIDRYFSGDERLEDYSKRLTFQENVDKMVKDLDMAISLLPDDWDNTAAGQLTAGSNIGRIHKGAALALKAKAYLFAGSPLQNGFSGGTFQYNKQYMEKAATAAWDCIKWAEETGKSQLTPWTHYPNMFARNDGGVAWTNEVLLSRIEATGVGNLMIRRLNRTYTARHARFQVGGNNANIECLNQLYADRFEMADGTLYKPGNAAQGGYDDVTEKRWENRDPRFRKNIYVNGDTAGFHPNLMLEMWSTPTPGRDRGLNNGVSQRTPYLIKKFWPRGVNGLDGLIHNISLHTPILRLADIYLTYAEAVTVAYGPSSRAPGAAYTAVEAVNKVRERANMPPATADAPGYSHLAGDNAAAPYSNFLALIRNERFVELCFEGHWRWDMARWYVLHLDQSRQYWDLRFDRDLTTFNRAQIGYMVFENPKHYWMPIPRPQTQIFQNFPQNPGWN